MTPGPTPTRASLAAPSTALRGRRLPIARVAWAASIVLALVLFVVAAVMVRRRSDDGMVLLTALFLVLLGAANDPITQALVDVYPALDPPARLSSSRIGIT